MNKETKVGLLVGLSFIVLFGVILSNQAPDIVAPPEKPMLNPATPRHGDAQIVRQIETTSPAPEPVDVVAEGTDPQAPANTSASSEQPAKADPKSTSDSALAEGSATGKTDAQADAKPAGTAKAITADQLGPETADAEPGDDGMQMISSNVDADGTKTTVYVVKNGDNLAKISRQFYGDASNHNIDKIFAANKDKMPNKKTLQVGMKLQVPATAHKDTSADGLLSSGKFDEVDILKPAGKTKDAPAAKEAATDKQATAKDPKDAQDPKDIKQPSKDAAKPTAKTAVAEVSQETLDDILLKHAGSEPSHAKTTSPGLARVTEPVDKIGDKDAEAKSSDKKDSDKTDKKEIDKAALASRENCKHYQIQKGDTWYRLAAKFMGDTKHWHDLYALNDDILPDATKLRPGVKIRVPAGAKGRLDLVVE